MEDMEKEMSKIERPHVEVKEEEEASELAEKATKGKEEAKK